MQYLCFPECRVAVPLGVNTLIVWDAGQLHGTSVPVSVLKGRPDKREMTTRLKKLCPLRCSIAYYCNGLTSSSQAIARKRRGLAFGAQATPRQLPSRALVPFPRAERVGGI